MPQLIQMALTVLTKYPPVTQIMVVSFSVLAAIPTLVSAVVALWHGLVLVASAAALVPGLGVLQKLADSLKVDEQVLDNGANQIINLINRISAIKPPSLPQEGQK